MVEDGKRNVSGVEEEEEEEEVVVGSDARMVYPNRAMVKRGYWGCWVPD